MSSPSPFRSVSAVVFITLVQASCGSCQPNERGAEVAHQDGDGASDEQPTGTGGAGPGKVDGGGLLDGGAKDAGDFARSWDDALGLGAPTLVYDFGPNSAEGSIYAIAVDTQYLYWVQADRAIYRAARDGQGAAEKIESGSRKTFAEQSMHVDATHLYWIGGDGNLGRLEKSSGQVSSLAQLEVDARELTMAGDADSLFLVRPGCDTFVRVSKATGEVVTATAAPNPAAGGYFGLTLAATHVYCTAGGAGTKGGTVQRWPKAGGAIEQVVQVADLRPPLYPQVGGMAVASERLFFIAAFAGTPPPTSYLLGAVPASGGEMETLAEITGGAGAFPMLHDAVGGRLYWINQSFPSALLAYSLADAKITRNDFDEAHSRNSGLVDGGDSVYWFQNDPRVRIFRHAKLGR